MISGTHLGNPPAEGRPLKLPYAHKKTAAIAAANI